MCRQPRGPGSAPFEICPNAAGGLLESRFFAATAYHAMIELNPIRQRIADLNGRLDSLRGYL
jgi:hypothetical protein